MIEQTSTENKIIDLEARALTLPDRYRKLAIRSPIDLEQANEAILYVKKTLALANGLFDPIIRAAHKTHREALDQKKRVVVPIQVAERLVKDAIGIYYAEQERKRLEAEEVARKAEEERREKEEESIQSALAAEEAGDKEEAERILDEGMKIELPPTIVPEIPKMAGVAVRDIWKFEIVDKSKIKIEFMLADEAKIGKIVRAAKKDAEKMVGGIRVYSEKSVAARTG